MGEVSTITQAAQNQLVSKWRLSPLISLFRGLSFVLLFVPRALVDRLFSKVEKNEDMPPETKKADAASKEVLLETSAFCDIEFEEVVIERPEWQVSDLPAPYQKQLQSRLDAQYSIDFNKIIRHDDPSVDERARFRFMMDNRQYVALIDLRGETALDDQAKARITDHFRGYAVILHD